MDADRVAAIDAFVADRGKNGYRVLAVASRTVARQACYTQADESGLELAGFLLFHDPPKPGAAAAIAALRVHGVTLKVITGDNIHVARHIAAQVGLAEATTLTGAEIAAMRDEALWHAAERTDLFAEVDPNQKERIILALKKTGHVVGYEAVARLASDAGGLGSAEAGARLLRCGRNELAAADRFATLRLVLRHFASPMVIILAVAAVVSAVAGAWTDSIVIGAIVGLSGLIGAWRESAAGRAIDRLREHVALRVRVLRDGGEVTGARRWHAGRSRVRRPAARRG